MRVFLPSLPIQPILVALQILTGACAGARANSARLRGRRRGRVSRDLVAALLETCQCTSQRLQRRNNFFKYVIAYWWKMYERVALQRMSECFKVGAL